MMQRESLLPRAWRDTANVRKSTAWWIAAILSGATLAVAGYYIAPGGASLLFAIGGVVLGFFGPYLLALAWHVPGASVRQREAEWAKMGPVVRRTPGRTTPR